jgi:redox-sensitive bicupin YhaK (pirin superfamily)
MSSTILEAGQSLDYAFAEGRRGFLQVVKGQVQMGDEKLLPGDGVAIVDTSSITVAASEEAELLLFDMV